MNLTADRSIFRARVRDFSPQEFVIERSLAMYSAAVALADEESMSDLMGIGTGNNVKQESFYEVVLQSYLFLGFPRMLGAAEIFQKHFHSRAVNPVTEPISPEESERWFENGVDLCKRVYGHKYEPLKKRVETMAPEVFRWMINEGYGKVLSRPQLDIQIRELCIMAFLMMEHRPRQLRSHMIGAINVGAEPSLLRMTIDDIGSSAGDGLHSARSILEEIG